MKKVLITVLTLVAAAGLVSTIQEQLREQRLAAEKLEREHEEERRRQEELERREARRREFVGLVSQAAFGHLWTSSPTATDEIDSSVQKARLSRIYQADTASVENGKLAALWADARQHAERGLLALYAIDQLREKQPSGWEVLKSLDPESDSDAWWRRIGSEFGQAGLSAEFRRAELELMGPLARVEDEVDAIGLPALSNAVEVTYYPSWRGTFQSEKLELQNTFSGDLDDALVLVSIVDAGGTVRRHIHHVERWPSGSTLIAQYLVGESSYSNGQTVVEPRSVQATIVSSAGVARESDALDISRWNELASSYLSRVRFQGAYLGPYVEDVTRRLYGPGFGFSFTGLPKLPIKAMHISFVGTDGRRYSSAVTVENFSPSTWHQLRIAPTVAISTAELSIEFYDTSLRVLIKNRSNGEIILPALAGTLSLDNN